MKDSAVKGIKKDILAGKLTQKQIGKKWGCSRSAVSNIATGRSHKDKNTLPVKVSGGQIKSNDPEIQNVALLGQIENLRSERNTLKRQLKVASGTSSHIQSIMDKLSPSVGAIPKVKKVKKPSTNRGKAIEETLVLVLSDTHLDEVVTPDEVEGLEDFDFAVGVRRCEELVESLLRFSQTTLTNFKFKKLVIFGLGDYGSFSLHGHTKDSYFGDVFRNTLAIGQLFGAMFCELSAHFEEVEVHNIAGNHGRLTPKHGFSKKDASANYDDLAMRITELHCVNNPNVKFHFPQGVSAIVDVEGYKFHLSHGHTKSGGSAAWNRAKKMSQTVIPLHGGEVDYVIQGHYHTPGVVTVSGGATLIGNGALLACDQYSLQALGEASTPSQFIFGVHRNRGMTWRLPIQVKTKGEKSGPKRYQLPCLETWDHV